MGQHVSANKNIVWRIKGGEAHDVSLDISKWQRDLDAEIRRLKFFEARLMHAAPGNRFKRELEREWCADARTGGPSVDLSEDLITGTALGRANDNSNGWPMLDKLIDRLANSDLGPKGFFVICHRGEPHDLREEDVDGWS